MENDPKTKSSKTLAAQVVVYRVLGLNKEDSIKAMEELLKRKEAGDTFDFNAYINERIDLMPKPSNNTQSKNIINQIKDYVKF